MPNQENDPVLRRTSKPGKRWAGLLALTLICLVLGLLLVIQLRTQRAARQTPSDQDWAFMIADLVDSNARLRDETAAIQGQLVELQNAQGGGILLESLVDEVNRLRIANGLVEVSGPGLEVLAATPVSVLDLQDLINELRNAGAEALAINGQRLVAQSAVTTDGSSILVDGQAVQPPYRLQAIGDPQNLEAALLRPGGLVSLLRQNNRGLSITTQQKAKLTLPVRSQSVQFVYAKPVE
jgi:uncharacterized protein YlxW (UPF0749 family)